MRHTIALLAGGRAGAKCSAKQSVCIVGKLLTKTDGVFVARWLRHPLSTASVVPSGARLSKLMARQVDLARPGVVVELGGGTGSITEAILAVGVAPENLVVFERD